LNPAASSAFFRQASSFQGARLSCGTGGFSPLPDLIGDQMMFIKWLLCPVSEPEKNGR